MQMDFCVLTEKLKLTGMSCSNFTGAITKAFKRVNGVEDAIVSLSNSVAFVRYDESHSSLEQLKSVLKEAGFAVVQLKDAEELHLSWFGIGTAL